MVCYRRRGHNEGDDPSMTQPLMYDLIEAKRSVRKLYTEALIGRGDITVEEAEQALRDYQEQLERVFAETREASSRSRRPTTTIEPPVADGRPHGGTAPARPRSAEVSSGSATPHVDVPEGFTVHPKLAAAAAASGAAMASEGGIDWAIGELFAFGSLLLEGVPVRLAGQDTRRGTFVQRHAVLIDRETGDGVDPADAPGRRPGARSGSTTRC